MQKDKKIVIIGGGLSALTTAYYLSKHNIDSVILEASSRLGGRIQTVKGVLDTPLELGATWFSGIHTHLFSLTEELGLKKYPQFSDGISLFQTKSFEPPQRFFVPESQTPSYRIAGGTQKLIDTLEETLRREQIYLNCKVTDVEEAGDGLLVKTESGKRFTADHVVVCIPPHLAANKISFTPELPKELQSLLPTVQTWMSGAIKFTIEYSEPFWRQEGFSGMLYSHAGIVVEMYDHTNFEETKFGFTGFLNGGAAGYSQEVRKEYALKQLAELLGEKALEPVSYYDKVWTDEYISGGPQMISRPHQNNGHPLLQFGYLNDKLFFSNTETSAEFSGYMEGAVISANNIVERLIK
ncbi:flavin monoamine oxidase family protein [Chryseobacterium pennipullorum]|uniref:Amine oxidase n=1 Tax=Chryseobacterium pennipullorum TaxID=2258963 RepID=A0A3D9B2G8_9FLAO|nr:NAD(P)/FAD-dependent oxidoreductase [Chryseobacterium pennipullorum]REC47538.1 amine oxidase [Chryseobacterium pennipullorum]